MYHSETKQVERARWVKFIDHFHTEQAQNDVGPLFPDRKSSEAIAKSPKISEIPNIAEKQDNEPLVVDLQADTEQPHDNTNMPKEQSLLERYPTRTRNKPSFYGQDKLDDNLNHTIDYCYKLANIPLDYQQAIEWPEASTWREARIDNDTFELLVPCPEDRQIVGAKWVYTIKTDQNETMANAVQEAKFLNQLCKDMKVSINQGKTLIRIDNQGAMNLAKNPVHHQRTKHIDIKYHFIRLEIQEGRINLEYIPTEQNMADIFTKAASRNKLESFRTSMLGG